MKQDTNYNGDIWTLFRVIFKPNNDPKSRLPPPPHVAREVISIQAEQAEIISIQGSISFQTMEVISIHGALATLA